jgi:hypothetical protein
MKMRTRPGVSICGSLGNVLWIVEIVKATSSFTEMAVIKSGYVSGVHIHAKAEQRTHMSASS